MQEMKGYHGGIVHPPPARSLAVSRIGISRLSRRSNPGESRRRSIGGWRQPEGSMIDSRWGQSCNPALFAKGRWGQSCNPEVDGVGRWGQSCNPASLANVTRRFVIDRPLRLVLPNSLYHVIANGNEQKDVFRTTTTAADILVDWLTMASETGEVGLPETMAGL